MNIVDECKKQDTECKTLIIHGGKYKTQLSVKFGNRKVWQKPNPRHVLSFIPGTIREVNVAEGDKVTKGDQLLVLEAMKMLNRIEAPINGVISKIYVEVDERIPKGKLMLEFE